MYETYIEKKLRISLTKTLVNALNPILLNSSEDPQKPNRRQEAGTKRETEESHNKLFYEHARKHTFFFYR
jgi:hypothetical protein